MILKHLKRKLFKNFRSNIDKMLDGFNKENPLSESQQYEVDKNSAIGAKRDHATATEKSHKTQDHWDKF